MSILVEQQDETINAIETTAGAVEKDVEQGFVLPLVTGVACLLIVYSSSLGHADKAVVSARAARKKRWICFAIIIGKSHSDIPSTFPELSLVILAIIAIVLAIHFAGAKK
jgi:syntaxin 1B/2/3